MPSKEFYLTLVAGHFFYKMDKGQGFIYLNRKILSWEWYDDINTCRLFIHCLLKANHTNAKWHGHNIERGEFITSISKLSEELNTSSQSIRTSLKKLKKTKELTSKSTNKFTAIKVVNYSDYQCQKISTNKQTQNEQQTTNKRLTTNNNDNNNNNDNIKNKQKDFEEFWQKYDSKKSKKTAFKAYEKALKSASHKEILEGLQRFVNTRNPDKTYWKHPATWLNQECWSDEYSQEQNQQEQKPDSFLNYLIRQEGL